MCFGFLFILELFIFKFGEIVRTAISIGPNSPKFFQYDLAENELHLIDW